MAGGNEFSIHDLKCPSCGGPLQLPGGADTVVCPFCGSTVHVSYGDGVQGALSGVEPDGTIRDRGTGYGLFRAHVAGGFQVVGTALQATGNSSRPHIPQVELRDKAGSVIVVGAGNAGTRRSAGMNALMGMYGAQTMGADRANYADVPDPEALADEAANAAAASVGAVDVRFERQLACPDLEKRGQRALQRFQRLAQAQGARVANPFIGVIMRVYECSREGHLWKAVAFVQLSACKDGTRLGEGFGGIAEGVTGLMEGIGSLFGEQAPGQTPGQQPVQAQTQAQTQGGQRESAMDFFMGGGLIGKMRRDRRAAQEAQAAQAAQAAQPQQHQSQQPRQQAAPSQSAQSQVAAQADSSGWCSPDFASYVTSGTIYWAVDAIVTMAVPAASFDSRFNDVFLPLVGSLELHPDVENLAIQIAMQEAAQIGQATQTQLAQNQAAFNAQQAAHRQQQAAFNSYNDSISAARDSRQAQFMAASHAAQGHAAPDFSEAIRGVNTYTTSDGREVELSVHADRAYENQAGDVVGASGGFEPGAGWTEIPRT